MLSTDTEAKALVQVKGGTKVICLTEVGEQIRVVPCSFSKGSNADLITIFKETRFI